MSKAERYICEKCEKRRPCILIFSGDCLPLVCPCSSDGTEADWKFDSNEEDVNISVVSGTKTVNINIHDRHIQNNEENQKEEESES